MNLDHLSEIELKKLLSQYLRNCRNYDPKSQKLAARHWWGKVEQVKAALKQKKGQK